jgi:hypothetical protein
MPNNNVPNSGRSNQEPDRSSQQQQQGASRGSNQGQSGSSSANRGSDVDRVQSQAQQSRKESADRGSNVGQSPIAGSSSANRGSDMGRNEGRNEGSRGADLGQDRDSIPASRVASDVGVSGASNADQFGSYDEDTQEDLSSRGGSGAGGFRGSNAGANSNIADQSSDLGAGPGVRSSMGQTGNAGSSLVSPRSQMSDRDQDANEVFDNEDIDDSETGRSQSDRERGSGGGFSRGSGNVR